MKTVILSRTGNAPVRFEGEKISQSQKKIVEGRAYDLTIYRIEMTGRFVAALQYQTNWQGESDSSFAFAGTPQEIVSWLREVDPSEHIRGFPPGPSYEERQWRLMRDARRALDLVTQDVLDDEALKEAFAAPLEDAVQDQYEALDLEFVCQFVADTLAGFPLTEREACAVCEANNGSILLEGSVMSVASNVIDTPGLAEKWRVDAKDLARRIFEADRAVRFSLAWACVQFWRAGEMTGADLLRECGFTIVKASRVSS